MQHRARRRGNLTKYLNIPENKNTTLNGSVIYSKLVVVLMVYVVMDVITRK